MLVAVAALLTGKGFVLILLLAGREALWRWRPLPGLSREASRRIRQSRWQSFRLNTRIEIWDVYTYVAGIFFPGLIFVMPLQTNDSVLGTLVGIYALLIAPMSVTVARRWIQRRMKARKREADRLRRDRDLSFRCWDSDGWKGARQRFYIQNHLSTIAGTARLSSPAKLLRCDQTLSYFAYFPYRSVALRVPAPTKSQVGVGPVGLYL